MGDGRKTWLVLEDGTYFEGLSFGVGREICGWVHSDHGVDNDIKAINHPVSS
jgi:hypothetical protein